ncbi:glycosyltransferase [Winogradskyella bathintestinalis]|uniref:Glycosyltransferase n=1 Tax=Winogradskyella bathintestinalis TaxID=3035208 RepID=A0ABT7ZVJ3_9FLAO|nr:glycosyltransferase [Winogradskyella bathintestinalis]MDN3493023.1 glycosyltransferase [Winogradskyella bathintestinalis]
MKKDLLIIGLVWPEPHGSAAGSRILQLVEQFQNQNYTITFCSAAKMSDKSFDLNSINVETKSIRLNDSSFDLFIKELQPNAVLFDRFMTEEQYGWRVAEQCPNAIRILDTEDFHGLRKAREVALKHNEELSRDHFQNDITKREIASIYRCDLSLIISEAEIEILSEEFNIDLCLLYYLPFLLEPIQEEKVSQLPTFEAREHFITIGNFLHAPNYDAILYLKQKIWPLIRQQLPKTELHIYGAYESQKITQLHNKQNGFLIKGFAKDANEVMQNAKICLAPLRFGAGLKGKLVDAMRNGTPCIMTEIAAEGMFGNLEANGFIEDNLEAFVEQAVSIYTRTEVWKQKQQNGFQILNQRFNRLIFEDGFTSQIKWLSENLQTHRKNNFIGQILRHQSMQSTKYMSKWIEAKNS